jgi:transposase InsO family protein
MRKILLSVKKLASIWPGKSEGALEKDIQRGKIVMVERLSKQEAARGGLPWDKGGAGGKGGNRRAYINLSDPALPFFVRLQYHQAISQQPHATAAPPLTETQAPVSGPGPAASLAALNPPGADRQGETAVSPSPVPGALSAAGPASSNDMTDEEIAEEACHRAPEFNRKVAVRYQAYLTWSAAEPGETEKSKIGKWNALHPDYQLSEPSVSRVKKKMKQYGPIALLGKYGKGNEGIVKPEDLETFAAYSLNGASAEKAWLGTLGRAFQRDGTVTVGNFPSSSTFLRRLHQKYSKEQIFYKREGPEAYKNKFGRYVDRDHSVYLCGDAYVGDHVQLDMLVTLKDGRKVRPWVTKIADMKSSKVLGYFLSETPPNTDNICAAFFRACLDYGLPHYFYVDNGRDFSAFVGGKRAIVKAQFDEVKLRSIFFTLRRSNDEPGIQLITAIPRNARGKTIERDFLTDHLYFETGLHGYTGNRPENRPEALKGEIKKEQLLSYEDLEARLEDFYVNVANKKPRKGKRLQGACPNELWEREVKVIRKGSPAALRMLLMRRSGPFRIGRNGVYDRQYKVTYWGEFMSGLKDEEIYLRRDSKKFQVAWVEDPQGRYLGEAGIAERVAAIATTDIERKKLQDALAAQRREARARRESVKDIEKVPAEQAMKDLALGLKLVNEDRGYIPGSAPAPVIEIQRTPADEAIRERERLNKIGTQDLSAIRPPRRERGLKIFPYDADRRRAEEERNAETTGLPRGAE